MTTHIMRSTGRRAKFALAHSHCLFSSKCFNETFEISLIHFHHLSYELSLFSYILLNSWNPIPFASNQGDFSRDFAALNTIANS